MEALFLLFDTLCKNICGNKRLLRRFCSRLASTNFPYYWVYKNTFLKTSFGKIGSKIRASLKCSNEVPENGTKSKLSI